MIGLQERIETARDASSKVAEQDRVREQARELPRLLAERERQAQRRAAAARLAAAREAAREALADITPHVHGWNEKFLAVVADCEQLVAELPGLQQRIYSAAAGLRAAAAAAHRPEPVATGNPLPAGMQDDGFSAAWQEAGGNDPALACFPADAEGLAALLKRELSRHARVALYDPLHGASAFVNRR